MPNLKPVRVRFAPSPTGFVHLGNIRSTLFDYLFAHHTKGTFILRLEDTDRERLVPEAIDYIKSSLRWLGLDWDEGVDVGGPHEPYIQSERLELYTKYSAELTKKVSLYPCWCSPERLEGLRQDAQKTGKPFKYDRHCLDHPQSLDEPHVLRFKVPDGRKITWEDGVRGAVTFDSDDLDDFVCIKSDGFPTYNFAVVVDDHLMEITHVLRGDEFVSTTPKNLLISQAFGWEPPIYVHLPQVLGADKAKLSKRHGAQPILEYRDQGYLPESIVNFLALLGWHPGEGSTDEIFTRDELVKRFELERIQKSPAVFDPERLLWFNGAHIRKLSLDELLKRCADFWPPAAAKSDQAYLKQVLALVHDRLKTLGELPELTDFFFADPELAVGQFELGDGLTPSEACKCLQTALDGLTEASGGAFGAQELEARIRGTVYAQIEALQLPHVTKLGSFLMVLRVALTGQTATPGLFETMEVLGQETVDRRLQAALKLLSPPNK